MDSQYDVKTWANQTTVGRRIYNYDFRLRGGELNGWRLLKAVPMHSDRTMSETTYLWQSADSPDQHLVRVNVVELMDWRKAQNHLLEMLAHTMRPDLPRGSGELAEVGDIEFVARSPQTDAPAALFFTRGNIAVAVSSAGPATVDVSPFATMVDRVLSEPPARVPAIRGIAKRQAPKTVVARGKRAASLVRNLKSVGDRWLKVIVPDGEVRRKGNALAYVTSQPGKKTVQIFSIRTPARARTRKSASKAR